MPPFTNGTGWQAIYRRMVEWQQKIGGRNELTMIGEHDPDLPVSKSEAGLEVRKWCWQV